MAGYFDGLRAIEAGVATGDIKVTRDGSEYVFEGRTYDAASFLKRQFMARWDRDARVWRTRLHAMPESNAARRRDMIDEWLSE